MGLALCLGGSACSRKSSQKRYLARAETEFAAERYDRAEIDYLAVLKIAPLEPIAVTRLGLIYFAEGKSPQAHSFLQKAVEMNPDNADVRLKLGLTYMAFHQPKEAWKEATRVLRQSPTNEDALLLLADAAFTNQIPEARQILEALPGQAKDSAGYHLALGTLGFHQEHFAEAEAQFKAGLACDPRSSAAYMALATLYLFRNDLQQAEPALKSAADLAPLRSIRRLGYAEFRLKQGALGEAKAAIEDLTKKAPDYLPAWVFLARVAMAEGKPEQCSAMLDKILGRDPINYDALTLAGNLLLAQGRGTNAVVLFQRMAAVYPLDPMVYQRTGVAHLLNRDPTKAVASLEHALALDPHLSETILLLAEIHIRQGDVPVAIAALNQLVKQQPSLTKAHLLLGNAYLLQKNPEGALAVYRGLARLYPNDPQAVFLVGNVLTRLGRKTEARQAFKRAREISPGFLPPLEQLVDLDLIEHDYAAAAERVKEQIARNPTGAEPWLLIAKIHLAHADALVVQASGRTPGSTGPKLRIADVPAAQPEAGLAEDALKQALVVNPKLRTTYLMLAQLYVAENQHQQALDRLAGWVAGTNDVLALMQIATIHEELNQFSAARVAYEKLLSIDPNFVAALNNLAYLYSERFGEKDKAYELAERARRLLPHDPFTADTLGWILYRRAEYVRVAGVTDESAGKHLYRRAEYARAAGLIEESALKLPSDPEIQFHLGMARYMLGEEDGARAALQQAVQAAKVFPGQDEGRRRLALLLMDIATASPAALVELEKRVRANPDDPVALSRLAAIQERDGAFDQARRTYELALAQDPRNPQPMLRLAQLYSERLRNPGKALALAKEAHSLAPEDARISGTLGHVVFQAGDYQWAASLLEESARKLPNDPGILYDLAWARYSLGRVAAAEATMRAISQTAVPSPRSDAARGFLVLTAAAASPALAEKLEAAVQQALSTNPGYVPALMASGVIHERRAQFKEAAEQYERVLARYPLFSPATRNLALLCAGSLSDDPRAYVLATKARESFPEDAVLARTLGVLAFRRGEYARCAQLLEESAREQDPDADLLFYLAMAHHRLKEAAPGKAALQRGLALQPQSKLAEEAKRLLADQK